MAEELSHSEQQSRQLPGLVNLLTLGLIDRFSYNFRRYHEDADQPQPGDLPKLCHEISYQLYAYRNALAAMDDDDEILAQAGSLVVLTSRISDKLYRLHHDLLERDADEIAPVIKNIDKLNQFISYYREDPLEASTGLIDEQIRLMDDIRSCLI